MDLFIYSDESGVFDQKHEDYFVFGGLICFGKNNKDLISRSYKHVENVIRSNCSSLSCQELKACKLSNAKKSSIYRSMNNVYKFAVVIDQKKVNANVFNSPKHKQRYLDFCYKIVLKKAIKSLMSNRIIKETDIDSIHIYCDEHTTATDGRYELKEGLLNEFKYGTFNMEYDHFYDPILPNLKGLDVNYCNSATTTLIRAADIIANNIYHKAIANNGVLTSLSGIFVMKQPSNIIIKNGLDKIKK